MNLYLSKMQKTKMGQSKLNTLLLRKMHGAITRTNLQFT